MSARRPIALRITRLYLIERKPCDAHVGYLFSGRGCRKPATWRMGRQNFCGSHANAAAMRLLRAKMNGRKT